MENLFVPFNIGEKLALLKFNEPCLAAYVWHGGKDKPEDYPENFLPSPRRNSELSQDLCAPLYQQVIDWLREKHNIEIYCPNYYKNSRGYKPEYECRVNGKQLSHPPQGHALSSVELYPTYYQAVERAIEEALKQL